MNSDDIDINTSFFFDTEKMETRKINLINSTIKDMLSSIKDTSEIKKYKLSSQYEHIANEISYIPSVADILQLSISHDEKCILIEKLLVLIHIPIMSVEFFDLKRLLIDSINSYQKLIEYNKSDNTSDNTSIDVLHVLEENKTNKPIEYQIHDMDIDIEDKKYLYNRYKTLSKNVVLNSNYAIKLTNWLDTIFKIPTKTKNIEIVDIKEYIFDIRSKLNQEIYGLDDVKERLIMFLHRRIVNPSTPGASIALAGPPGIAKTTIINIFAKITDTPFFQINAASMKEIGFLIGHNFTYENSGPGCIVQALIKMGYKNGIIYFDEFDKIPNGSELSKVLLHITDASQNNKFYDQYIGERFNIDLSKIWFIYSMNDKNNVDKTLIDRINLIDIKGYSVEDHENILLIHVLPKLLKENNLDIGSIVITSEIMRYIINISHKKLTDEQRVGVRQVRQLLEEIIIKISFLFTMKDDGINHSFSFHIHNIKIPLILTKEHLSDLAIK